MKKPIRLSIVLALLCVVAAPIASFAQSDSARLWTVITVDVHSNMIPEFEGLQKELNVAYKKAGMKERRISRVVRGNSSQYLIATPHDSYAELDEGNAFMTKAMGEAGAAQWIARVTKCTKSRSVETVRELPDISIPIDPSRKPKLMLIITTENLPGMAPAYSTWLTEKWHPAMKAAGANGVFFYHSAWGGSQREWVQIVPLDSWAALDTRNPVHRHLGEEAYRELRKGVGAMTHSPTRRIAMTRPDLSILP